MEVFDGLLGVYFGQAYISNSPDRPNDADLGSGSFLASFFRGQRNGLLGAAVGGFLFLTTGTSNGDVGLSVHVVEQEPPLDDSWEECVEASFVPETSVVAVYDWDRTGVCEIPLGKQTYRVRYTACRMDAGHAGTGRDFYGLWFWPAPVAPDAVIRQTSASAAYWRNTGRIAVRDRKLRAGRFSLPPM